MSLAVLRSDQSCEQLFFVSLKCEQIWVRDFLAHNITLWLHGKLSAFECKIVLIMTPPYAEASILVLGKSLSFQWRSAPPQNATGLCDKSWAEYVPLHLY